MHERARYFEQWCCWIDHYGKEPPKVLYMWSDRLRAVPPWSRKGILNIDIVGRVLETTLLTLVMNITDVDDKIIKRGREGYLYKKFCDDVSGCWRNVPGKVWQRSKHTGCCRRIHVGAARSWKLQKLEERQLYLKRVDEARASFQMLMM